MSRSEVILFRQSGAGRRLSLTSPRPQHGSSTGFQFSVQSVGGNFFLPSYGPDQERGSGLLWQIDNGPAGSVRMQPFSLPMDPHGSATATELAFDVQVFPGLGLLDVPSGRGSNAKVVGLLATGILFLWEQSPSGDLPDGPGSAVRFYDLSAQLHSHGSPTALGTSGGTLLVGCSGGVVLGLPHAAFFTAATPQPAFELRTNGWGGINRLISGIFSQAAQPPVAACLSLQLPDRPPLALIVYDDCTVRAFSLERGHQEVFSDNLSGASGQLQQQQEAAPSKRWVVASAMLCSGRGGDSALVATLESCDFTQKHTWLFSLAPAGGAAAGRLAIQRSQELAGLGAAATVVSASLDGDTVWVLTRAQGAVHAVGFSRATGQPSTPALLHEQQHSLAFEDADQSNSVVTKVRRAEALRCSCNLCLLRLLH